MTEHFSKEEFTRSETADRLVIDNTLPDDLIETAKYTLSRLEEIRQAYGKPIIITSGYRCPELNKAVGGKPNSQHLKAEAVDLKWDLDLYKLIKDHFEFDQLIIEKNSRTKWIHLSFKRSNERNQSFNLSL
nr:endolysin [Herelleviridae sp.]CAI9751959.1 endolysin [uncultured phage]